MPQRGAAGSWFAHRLEHGRGTAATRDRDPGPARRIRPCQAPGKARGCLQACHSVRSRGRFCSREAACSAKALRRRWNGLPPESLETERSGSVRGRRTAHTSRPRMGQCARVEVGLFSDSPLYACLPAGSPVAQATQQELIEEISHESVTPPAPRRRRSFR